MRLEPALDLDYGGHSFLKVGVSPAADAGHHSRSHRGRIAHLGALNGHT